MKVWLGHDKSTATGKLSFYVEVATVHDDVMFAVSTLVGRVKIDAYAIMR